jgi:hypothetical protein
LPDVNDRVRDTLLGVQVLHHAVHESSLAIGMFVADDGVAEVAEGRVGRPEGAENCGGSGSLAGLVDVLMGNLVDQAVELSVSSCGENIFETHDSTPRTSEIR